MPDNSFDIISKIELPEVSNAVQQALKEIQQRYDLKNSHSHIELREKENKLILSSADEFKLKAVIEILESKLVKRRAFKRARLWRRHSGGRIDGAPGSYASARHPHRKGARNREGDQGQQEKSPGLDSGRFRARFRQGSRHTPGSDRADARHRL